MKAFFGGCFSFIAGIFLLSLCLQYPPLFWAILFFFALMVILGIRNGRKQLRDNRANQVRMNQPLAKEDDLLEDDIRHHHELNGTPLPSTSKQRQDKAAPVPPPVQLDPEIEAEAAAFYESEADYYDDEGER